MSQAPILIIDATAYLFRSHYTIGHMKSRDGKSVGAIHGTITTLQHLVNTFNPSHIAVVFDPPGPSFRSEIYPEYKMHRPDIDPALRDQITPTQEAVAALGYQVIIKPGFEADDVIGTLSTMLSDQEQPVFIVSGDKDFIQLVNPNVSIYDHSKQKIYDVNNAGTRLGVPIEYTIDFLALCGDSADNIPGAKGIGEKTAQTLLNKFAGITDLYHDIENIDQTAGISKAVKKKLIDSHDNVLLSYKLATIKTDIDLGITKDDLLPQPILADQAAAIFNSWDLTQKLDQLNNSKLGFMPQVFYPAKFASLVNNDFNSNQANNSLFSNLTPDVASGPVAFQYKNTAHALDSEHKLQQFLNELNEQQKIFLYYDINQNKLAGIAISVVDQEQTTNYLISTRAHKDAIFFTQLQENHAIVYKFLSELIINPKYQLFSYNLKRLAHLINLDPQFLDLNNYCNSQDLFILSYSINSQNPNDFDKLAEKYLNVNLPSINSSHQTEKALNKAFDTINVEDLNSYLLARSQLMKELTNNFLGEVDAVNYYNLIERDLWQVLYTMEYVGINLDLKLLNELSEQWQQETSLIEAKVIELLTQEFSNSPLDLRNLANFNIQSPKQLKEILFEKLNLGTEFQQKKGSTAVDVLETISHPVAQGVLDYRSTNKLKTISDGLIKLADSQGLIHTTYEQGVVTGRLSSNDPNLQNIPVRSSEGKKIRSAFIAPEGRQLVALDYSQIELRIISVISNETNMINAFANDLDIHQTTAAEIFNVPLEQVNNEQRRLAKAINFGLIYGMSTHGLAMALDISRGEAQVYIDSYFRRYPNILKYMETTGNLGVKDGFVYTFGKRKIYLAEGNQAIIANNNRRSAINYPIQGTAAEIIKIAMYKVHNFIRDKQGIDLLLTVHDELVLSITPENMHYVVQIQEIMEQAIQFPVKLKVDYNLGDNWEQAH